jgi:hypothetical protein
MQVWTLEFRFFSQLNWDWVECKIIASSPEELEEAARKELQWSEDGPDTDEQWSKLSSKVREEILTLPLVTKRHG